MPFCKQITYYGERNELLAKRYLTYNFDTINLWQSA